MAKRKLTQEERTISRVKSYQDLFNSPVGRQVMNDLIANHSLLSSTFNGDVNQMLIKEGERNVILRILKIMKTDVAQFKERMDNYVKDSE